MSKLSELRELHIIAFPELYPGESPRGEYHMSERNIAKRCFEFIDAKYVEALNDEQDGQYESVTNN